MRGGGGGEEEEKKKSVKYNKIRSVTIINGPVASGPNLQPREHRRIPAGALKGAGVGPERGEAALPHAWVTPPRPPRGR